MPYVDKDELVRRLLIKPGDTVDRFTCRYADLQSVVCETHAQPTPYSFEYGYRRPCYGATLEDKLPLTITQFLGQMAADSQRKAMNSVLEEDHTKIGEIIFAILNWNDSWPVLVEGPRVFEPPDFSNLDAMGNVTYRMTQEMEWMTTQAYIKRFGSEPPTAPLLVTIANMWRDHPEFREEWRQ